MNHSFEFLLSYKVIMLIRFIPERWVRCLLKPILKNSENKKNIGRSKV